MPARDGDGPFGHIADARPVASSARPAVPGGRPPRAPAARLDQPAAGIGDDAEHTRTRGRAIRRTGRQREPHDHPDVRAAGAGLPRPPQALRRAAAVDGVGFEIAAGETYGLLGPNGAGKTTTISMICGLLRRDGGEVLVAGRPVDIGATDAKAAIGYVPQDLAIYPDLTARENLRFFGRLQRLRGKELDRRVDEVLAVIDLADRAGDRTDGFSGGMKRRLNIGIGLLHHPRLLVLDEPTVGVDPQSRNAILSSVADARAGGHGDPLHDPLHGGGRAALRPDRDHRRGPDPGRGHPPRARRPGRPEGPGRAGGRRDDRTGDGRAAGARRASRRRRRPTGESSWWSTEARHLLPRILETAAGAGAVVRSVEVVEPDLEAVFLHLTGKALRD